MTAPSPSTGVDGSVVDGSGFSDLLSEPSDISSLSSFSSNLSSFSSDSELSTPGKPRRPALPLAAMSAQTIEDEVRLEMKNLSKIIFAVYAQNDLEFFGKLVDVFNELDDIWINLSHHLLTAWEENLTMKHVVLLFNRIAKLLASSGGKIKQKDNSSAMLGKLGGYTSSQLESSTAIMARDQNTAELYSYEGEVGSEEITGERKNAGGAGGAGTTGDHHARSAGNAQGGAGAGAGAASAEASAAAPASAATIAQNQVLDALSPNYPFIAERMSFLPEKNRNFETPAPSNILIDFKEVSGSSDVVPSGYDGMTALMYLRTVKRRITQAFSVTIDRGQAVFLDNLSAALFTNIPASEMDHGKIYLVAILTERIRLPEDAEGSAGAGGNSASASGRGAHAHRSNAAAHHSNAPALTSVRKGIAAGVADISRVFSRKKGHLATGEAHRFVIKLFSSFTADDAGKKPAAGEAAAAAASAAVLGGGAGSAKLFAAMNKKLAMSIAMANSGWGELVDRIISGSDKGIAVNPRAERLVLSIKELRSEDEDEDAAGANVVGAAGAGSAIGGAGSSAGGANVVSAPTHTRGASTGGSSLSGTAAMSALASIATIDFNPLVGPSELVYLRVGRFRDLGVKFPARTYLTVEVRASSSRMRFAAGANDKQLDAWQFLSVSPGESLNEIVQVSGVSRRTSQDTDFLTFSVYASGRLLGQGKYLLRDGGRIYDTGLFQRSVQSVDIVGAGNSGIASLEISLQYVGTAYNVDSAAREVLEWRDDEMGGAMNGTQMNGSAGGIGAGAPLGSAASISAGAISGMLQRFRRCDAASLARFLPPLLFQLLRIFQRAIATGDGALKTSAFEAIVHTLDVTVARHHDEMALFDQFMREYRARLPAVGELLLSKLTAYFSAFNTAWNSVGRALCRVGVLILRLADACIRHRAEFVTQGYRLADALTMFLASRRETLVTDQLLVLDSLELILDVLRRSFQVSELASFAAAWVNATGMRGLGLVTDPAATALVNRRRGREHSILVSKLLLLRRLLHGFIMRRGSRASRELLMVAGFKVAYRVLLSPVVDMECARLALGVLLEIGGMTAFLVGGADGAGAAAGVIYSAGALRAGANRAAQGYPGYSADSHDGLVVTLFRSLPLLCRLFVRYHDHCAGQGLLAPRRSYTQLFPNCYPFTKYTLDSIVTDVVFCEPLMELSVVFCGYAELAYQRRDLIAAYVSCPAAYEAALANYAPLNEFLGPPGSAVSSPGDLAAFVAAMRAQLSTTHYPAARWLSVQALMAHAVERSVEMTASQVVGLLDSQLSAGQVGAAQISAGQFSAGQLSGADFDEACAAASDYIVALLSAATARAASVEHLAEIPRKGCLQIAGDVRTAAADTFAQLWDAVGAPASAQDRQRFHVTRFRGWQTQLVESSDTDRAARLLTYLLLFCMQKNTRCKQVGRQAFWAVVAGEIAASEDRAAASASAAAGSRAVSARAVSIRATSLDPASAQSSQAPAVTADNTTAGATAAATGAADDPLFLLEQRCVSALYDLFERRPTGYIPRAQDIRAFADSLLEDAQRNLDAEDIAQPAAARFADTIASYLDSFVGLQSIPAGAEFDDDRTFYKLRISGFLLDVGRPELFESFVAEMYRANLKKGNHAQAALSLQLLADTYEWNTATFLPACAYPAFPRQTMFARKAELYKAVASQFTKARQLVQAIGVFQALLDAYLRYNFDLVGLSHCHGQLARLYAAYEGTDRLEPTYFKIAFIGAGFPVSFRGKQFVYEGLPYEHISSISHRLIRLYPGSRIINNDDQAQQMLAEAPAPLGRYLHIKIIQPKSAWQRQQEAAAAAAANAAAASGVVGSAVVNGSGVVGSIRSAVASTGLATSAALTGPAAAFADAKNLNTFLSSRRLPGSSSATTLWTEEATYTTFMTFPTLMNRSEIQRTAVVKLSPVKNAIQALLKKEEELARIESLIEQDLRDGVTLGSIASSALFGNLSRILAGTVDSPVNGGMGQFRVFFDGAKRDQMAHENQQPVADYRVSADILKARFHGLVALLARMLKLHGLIVPETLRPQHEAMVELFGSNFKHEIAELQLDITTPLDYHAVIAELTGADDDRAQQRGSRRRLVSKAASAFAANQNGTGAPSSIITSSRHRRRRHHGSRHPSQRRYGSIPLAKTSTVDSYTLDESGFESRDSRLVSNGSFAYSEDGQSEMNRTVMSYK